MRQFNKHTGKVVPLDRSNVDTDQIIPKQFLKSIKRSGFGPNLFDDWRYLDSGEPGMDNSIRPVNPDFILNKDCYQAASILLTRENFGCGSSREHAPWALDDYGFRVIIAPSFADIFYSNCFKNALLPIQLSEEQVNNLFEISSLEQPINLLIDLEQQTITIPNGDILKFEIDNFRKQCLLDGLDEIGLTMQYQDEIKKYEEQRRKQAPWLFVEIKA